MISNSKSSQTMPSQQQILSPPPPEESNNAGKGEIDAPSSLISSKAPENEVVILEGNVTTTNTAAVVSPSVLTTSTNNVAPSAGTSCNGPVPVTSNSQAATNSKDDEEEDIIFEPSTHEFLPVDGKNKRVVGDYTTQSERKKLREKKRRQEISVAIERLSKMLLKLDPSSFMQHNNQLYHFTDGEKGIKRKSLNDDHDIYSSFPQRQVQHHPLNRTDIINHAVVMLEKLARESEESKIELLQVQHSMVMANKYSSTPPQPAPTTTTTTLPAPQHLTTTATTATQLQPAAPQNHFVAASHHPQQVIVGVSGDF